MQPPTLASLVPEGRLEQATYGLLTQGSLSPSIPAGFPLPPGTTILSKLVAANHVLFFPTERTFMGLVLSSPKEDAIVILGTHTALQWWEDFRANPRAWTTLDGVSGQVESGFADVYEGIEATDLGLPLRELVGRQAQSRKPLRIIGHSLGAAVAGLVAADAGVPTLRNFAMPKFSDLHLSMHAANKLSPESLVSRNVQDVVPMAPPFPLYQSVIPEAWFNSDAMGVAGDDASRHNMEHAYLAASLLAAA